MKFDIDRLSKSADGTRVFFIASCLSPEDADVLVEKLRKLKEESS